jgi:hypothetical protein
MKAFIEDLKKKINPALVKPAISCIAVFCLLVTSTIALFGNGTLGWFGSNDEVSANNMQTSIRGTNVELSYYAMGPDDTEYTEITSFAFRDYSNHDEKATLAQTVSGSYRVDCAITDGEGTLRYASLFDCRDKVTLLQFAASFTMPKNGKWNLRRRAKPSPMWRKPLKNPTV